MILRGSQSTSRSAGCAGRPVSVLSAKPPLARHTAARRRSADGASALDRDDALESPRTAQSRAARAAETQGTGRDAMTRYRIDPAPVALRTDSIRRAVLRIRLEEKSQAGPMFHFTAHVTDTY